MTATLPQTLAGCAGGGEPNSRPAKSWAIRFEPSIKNRAFLDCPSDPGPRSQDLATDIQGYNGGVSQGSGSARQRHLRLLRPARELDALEQGRIDQFPGHVVRFTVANPAQ